MKKKKLAEAEDYLRQVDLPESMGGGRKFVVDKLKEEEKNEQKEKDDIATTLQFKRKAKYEYRNRLSEYGQSLLEKADFGKGWESYCVPTDGSRVNILGKHFESKVGVLVIVKSPKGNVFVRGIKTTNEPEYDVKALNILAVQAENTVDSEKGLLMGEERTKSGIWMP